MNSSLGLTNVTVAIPTKAINTLLRDKDPSQTADAIATITKAVVNSLIKPTSSNSVESDEDEAASIRSFDSDEQASAADSDDCMGVYGPGERHLFQGTQIFVRDLYGKTQTFEIAEGATVWQLKCAIHRCAGIPQKEQVMSFGGKSLGKGRTLESVSKHADSCRL